MTENTKPEYEVPEHAVANWLLACATLAAARAGVDTESIEAVEALIDTPTAEKRRAPAGVRAKVEALASQVDLVRDAEGTIEARFTYHKFIGGREEDDALPSAVAPNMMDALNRARWMGYWPTVMRPAYTVLMRSLDVLRMRGLTDPDALTLYEQTLNGMHMMMLETIRQEAM